MFAVLNKRSVFLHALAITLLVGMYAYSAFIVHGPGYGTDSLRYIELALSFYHESQLPWMLLPLGTLWLNLLMHIDPAFVDCLQCMHETLPNWPAWDPRWVEHFGGAVAAEGKRAALAACRPWSNIGFYAGTLMGAIGVGLIWFAGWLASGRLTTAHLSAFVALLLDGYVRESVGYMTETLVIPLFTGVNVCVAYLVLGRARTMRKVVAVAIICGLLLGALILTRPPYELLLVALPLAAIVYLFRHWSQRREVTVAIAGILISAWLVVGPWVAYNYVVRGFVGVSQGYGVVILAERLHFNDMTWQQWIAAFPFWTSAQQWEPEPSDNWVIKLFGEEITGSLDKRHPDYFTRHPTEPRATLWAMPRAEAYRLVLGRLWSDLPKHLAVSMPLAWRGLNEFREGPYGIGAYKTTFYLLLIVGFVCSRRRGRVVLAGLAFGPLVILAVNALVSASVSRYNIGFQAPLSVGVALAIFWAMDGVSSKLRRTRRVNREGFSAHG